jgi:hypothetical protein
MYTKLSGSEAHEQEDYVESLLPVTNVQASPRRSTKVVAWTVFYLLCSSSMYAIHTRPPFSPLISCLLRLPINKLTVIYLPFANTCLFIQALCTVGILLAGKHFSFVSFPAFSAQKARLWTGVMFAWLLPMIVSMIALKYLTVETVVVFRTLSTFGVALGDRYFFGKQFSQPALVSMVVTVSGGMLYAISDAHFSGVGYFWGLMYFLATIYNGLYIKLIFTQSVDMSNWEKTYYNNLMALPVTLLLILFSESVPGIISSMLGMSIGGWLVILLSGVMGTAISVAGTNTRDLLTATSFNIAGNVNKFLSVGFSVLFLWAPLAPSFFCASPLDFFFAGADTLLQFLLPGLSSLCAAAQRTRTSPCSVRPVIIALQKRAEKVT